MQVGGRTVCLFTCMRYNYCHVDQSCCTDPARLPVSLTSFDDLAAARVKVRCSPATGEPVPLSSFFTFMGRQLCCVLEAYKALVALFVICFVLLAGMWWHSRADC